MPLDGNGNHNPPIPENPVRAGTLIKSDDFNTTIDDISDALSTAIYRDGQAPMEADLNMGHNSLVQVKSIRNDGQLSLISNDKLVLSADKEVVVDSDMRAKNIILQDGNKVSGYTATGGVENAGKSVLLNSAGQIDMSMIPFAPPSPSEVQLRRTTGAELNAGDFVYIATNDVIMPTTANPQALVVGFVLNDYQQGDLADVLLTGINNKVAVIGEITETNRTAYTSPNIANQITTINQDGQAIGIILSASSIYFRGLGGGGGGGAGGGAGGGGGGSNLFLSKYMSI